MVQSLMSQQMISCAAVSSATNMQRGASLRSTRLSRPHLKRVVIPSSVALTPAVLLGAMLKLTTGQIEKFVSVLIDELDVRAGDSDLEPDFDGENELL
jgi:hypothetical protein